MVVLTRDLRDAVFSARRRGISGLALFDVLIVMAIFMIIGMVAVSAVSRLRERALAEQGAAADPAKAEAARAAAEAAAEQSAQAASSGVNTWLLVVLGVIAVFFVAMFLAGGRGGRTPSQVAAQGPVQSAAELLAVRWAKALEAHDRVADAYAGLRLDPIAAIDHILLWDVTVPRTATFVTAYTAMTDLRSLHGSTVPAERADVIEYETAVRAASVAFDDAVAHARQVGAKDLSVGDQRLVRKAAGLLRRAQDEAAPTPERALAALRAKELLDQLAVLWPEEAAVAIEALARGELTAGV